MKPLGCRTMKHNIKITLILLVMFIVTQLIGLAVIHAYNSPKQVQIYNETTKIYENITINQTIPYGFQPPEEIKPVEALPSILISIVVAIALVFLLMTLKATWFLRAWFFVVVTIGISIALNSFLILAGVDYKYSYLIVLIVALPFSFYKIFKQDILIHNLTELLIYPGIAAVFVPILNLWTIIILLVLISIYDIYAVWHSGFMQKMAKFQINNLKVFGGFFVPYIPKELRDKLKSAKGKLKGKMKKVKISLAILGGGDVIFPIITAGVVYVSKGLFPALLVTLFATIALFILFMFSEKGKFYPAMPFITAGLLVGIGLGYLI